MIRALLVLLALALPAGAQEARQGTGAVVRWLDKVTGRTVDLEIRSGQATTEGRLTIQLEECRYPADGSADAFALLTIRDRLMQAPVFQGWMIASSPALSAMDHRRYDVWVIRCTTD
ncbi:MAG: DUF2155 domain-containing protein [Gemmobacter sp.]